MDEENQNISVQCKFDFISVFFLFFVYFQVFREIRLKLCFDNYDKAVNLLFIKHKKKQKKKKFQIM